MLKTASFSKIYICCGRTDLRKGTDGLSTIVKGQFQMDAFQEDVLFLFCGSKQDRFKALCWEGDGFVLMYKRSRTGASNGPGKGKMPAAYPRKNFTVSLTALRSSRNPRCARRSARKYHKFCA